MTAHRPSLPFPLLTPAPAGFLLGQYPHLVVLEKEFVGSPERLGECGIRKPAVDRRTVDPRQPRSSRDRRLLPVGVEEPPLAFIQALRLNIC